MRGIVWLIVLFAAAVVAATTLGRNDGLVTVAWEGWRTDLSLNLFLLVLLASCMLLVLAIQTLNDLFTLPKRARRWRAARRERAANATLREALAEYFGARYGRAHKAAVRALEFQPRAAELAADTSFQQLAQLLAAASLHRIQDRAQRDSVLQQALPDNATGQAPKHPPTTGEEALRLCAAEWALEDRDAERASSLLAGLSPGAARRTQALRLKMQASRAARQPLQALQTARLLAKHRAFSPVVAQGLLRSLAAEALDQVHDAGQMRRLWSQLDPADRRDPQVVARAAVHAARLGAIDEARQWLRPLWDQLASLSSDDRQAVALALIQCRAGMGVDWLPRVESATLTLPRDPAVAAAAGMVLCERQLWGKARGLLLQAASAEDLPAATRRLMWRQLAALARGENNEAEMHRCERAAAWLD